MALFRFVRQPNRPAIAPRPLTNKGKAPGSGVAMLGPPGGSRVAPTLPVKTEAPAFAISNEKKTFSVPTRFENKLRPVPVTSRTSLWPHTLPDWALVHSMLKLKVPRPDGLYVPRPNEVNCHPWSSPCGALFSIGRLLLIEFDRNTHRSRMIQIKYERRMGTRTARVKLRRADQRNVNVKIGTRATDVGYADCPVVSQAATATAAGVHINIIGCCLCCCR